MFFFRDNYKRRSLHFTPCVNQIVMSSSGITIMAKIQSTAANLYQHVYQRSSTAVRQQRSVTKLTKNNTRTGNSVTGSVSTSVGIRGFPDLLRCCKNARGLRREIFRPFPVAVTVTWTSPFPKP